MDILSEANVDQHLSDIIEAYLLAQGRCMMKDCVPSLSPYNRVATVIDNLGADCFVEGRIPYVLIDTVNVENGAISRGATDRRVGVCRLTNPSKPLVRERGRE